MNDVQRQSALITPDGLYRTMLERIWADGPKLAFCMLNPSTADAENDDPTIRRCMGFAKREKYAGIIVFNVFGYRATDPRKLLAAENPDGYPYNQQALSSWREHASEIICAWGVSPFGTEGSSYYARACAAIGTPMYCLGKTKDGWPKHPLYLPRTAEIVPFNSGIWGYEKQDRYPADGGGEEGK